MTTKCDVPSGGADGADAFVESPKLVQVEAETRPDFEELQKIERKRREILLRVSSMYLRRYIIHGQPSFHSQLMFFLRRSSHFGGSLCSGAERA